MDMVLLKTANGTLAPANDETAERIAKMKLGEAVRGDFKKMHNYRFFKKWFALVRMAFEFWSETQEPQMFRGMPILPEFERFRKDLTISAGFFRPVWNIRNEMRVEAESIAWNEMDLPRFEELYSATINAILRMLPDLCDNEEELRRRVDTVVMDFA
jgi:hypothetical protein